MLRDMVLYQMHLRSLDMFLRDQRYICSALTPYQQTMIISNIVASVFDNLLPSHKSSELKVELKEVAQEIDAVLASKIEKFFEGNVPDDEQAKTFAKMYMAYRILKMLIDWNLKKYMRMGISRD